MVELVADMLQRPKLDAAEFRKLRDRSINLIKAAKGSDPGQLMPAYANAFLFGEHPYGNPVGGTESSLAAVTHKDLLAYYADGLGGDRLIVSVSGDFDTATMRDALTAAFGTWRAATGAPQVEAPARAETSRVYLIDKPGATQTYFYIGNVGVARAYADRAELDLANTVFGGRFTSMLVTELRTKSGLSYSARSAFSRYSQPGSLFIVSFTETSTTVAALDVALGTLGQLKDAGLDADTLLSARNYVMGQFPPSLETAEHSRVFSLRSKQTGSMPRTLMITGPGFPPRHRRPSPRLSKRSIPREMRWCLSSSGMPNSFESRSPPTARSPKYPFRSPASIPDG